MKKLAKSKESIRVSMMTELRAISCCGAVDDVGIEVNWDRPAGMINWWVTRIRYQKSAFPQSDIAASESEISRIEAVLQQRYFIETDDGFSRGAHV
jgi:hypothetical protein